MKTLVAATLILLHTLADSVLGDLVVFEESFGVSSGGTYCEPLFPAGWSRHDLDGFTPAAGVAHVDAAWVTLDDDPFEAGNCAAVSTSWYSDDLPAEGADDWMVTPLVHVPEGARLSWRAFAAQPELYADGYEVRYSTSGADPEDFLVNPPLFAIQDENGSWTRRTVDLESAELTGRAVHFAFRNDSIDDYLLYVDDVRIWFEDAIFAEEFGGVDGSNLCAPEFPAGWIRHELDGGTPVESWIDDAWVAAVAFPDLAECAAFSASDYLEDTIQADDWMVTPAIALPADADLRWRAMAVNPDFPDGYEVRYSISGSTPADFLANPALFAVVAEDSAWTAHRLDLDGAGLGGATVRFAFRNHSNERDLLAIDAVEVVVPWLFRDGFESGFAGAWSETTGVSP